QFSMTRSAEGTFSYRFCRAFSDNSSIFVRSFGSFQDWQQKRWSSSGTTQAPSSAMEPFSS
ncbi:MAG: hypothetical protein J6M06_00830, partial [Synergistaceae bacterium]|nr:hypothetical protein [Synergistaceae bacterium]